MSNDCELRDDSALVKALDDAISKYKIMHGKGGANKSLEKERITIGTEESEVIVFNGGHEATSACVETENNTTDIPNGDQVQNTDYTYVDTQSAEDYNVLLNQYNTVEEERQKLLGQLYQYGNWDYQSYGYDSQYQPSNPPVCSCSTAISCGEDGGVIKAAMTAIDKVIDSFSKQDKEGNVVKDKTDLSVVLNAWFSAGFYTGKYLSEQASAKK